MLVAVLRLHFHRFDVLLASTLRFRLCVTLNVNRALGHFKEIGEMLVLTSDVDSVA